MVLAWFGASKPQAGNASLNDLIARKSYGKAIEVLKAELQRRKGDRNLRLRLGDVLALAGRAREAVEVFDAIADDYALSGRAAQAIAVLKRIEKIQPGREDVAEKLAYLINQQARPDSGPWSRPREMEGEFAEIGLELAPGAATAAPPPAAAAAPPPAAEPAPAAPAPEAAPADDASLLSDEAFRDELVALLESTFTPLPDPAPSAAVQTPLFRDFAQDELLAVMKGLRLVTFEPGQIVFSEGEPGDSLLVLTSGAVRAYVRSAAGRSVEVRQLAEGDFFGEISVLTGKPRTATITAATRCELLELDRPTLDGIAQTRPRVWTVLKEFYDQRANSSLESTARTGP